MKLILLFLSVIIFNTVSAQKFSQFFDFSMGDSIIIFINKFPQKNINKNTKMITTNTYGVSYISPENPGYLLKDVIFNFKEGKIYNISFTSDKRFYDMIRVVNGKPYKELTSYNPKTLKEISRTFLWISKRVTFRVNRVINDTGDYFCDIILN